MGHGKAKTPQFCEEWVGQEVKTAPSDSKWMHWLLGLPHIHEHSEIKHPRLQSMTGTVPIRSAIAQCMVILLVLPMLIEYRDIWRFPARSLVILDMYSIDLR